LASRLALAWLRRDDWPRWQAIDPELPAYETWLAKGQRLVELLGPGLVVKIDIDLDEFLEWCRANERPIGRDARAQFAGAARAAESRVPRGQRP
jgi:hypothetical protein